MTMEDKISTTRAAALGLLDYCRAQDWVGYDPYDALNSRVYRALPFLNFRLSRLALTQGVKRSPVNLRPLLLVKKTPNPKAIALFLSSLVRLTKSGTVDGRAEMPRLAEKLLALKSDGWAHPCWGYNFDWQQRHTLVPEGSPNIICTTFAGNALLDAHELNPGPGWDRAAVDAADFVLEDLFLREKGEKAFFRYTLVGRDEVHNANLLGAAFVCRVARLTGDTRLLGTALEATRFSVKRQHQDGSWDYGEAPTQHWIDNFHTGFNLVALSRIRDYARTEEFDAAIHRGFEFYKRSFFREDGAPKYYHSAVYPIDIHSAAQSIITLTEFADSRPDGVALAFKVLDWTLANLRSPRGYFYYQKKRRLTVRTSFIRWSQAWMLLALSTLLSNNRADGI